MKATRKNDVLIIFYNLTEEVLFGGVAMFQDVNF